ncbi:MAG: ABC transporter ATP-binding protein [Chlamydiae bacterium SM23_39]|nr:MAG: ABC transporter ATP-binding protein [Chlamydiae bacterium SM23_39]
MKFLLLAALKNKKHIFFAVLSLITLFILTIANQAEMFSLGIMANTGVDFFSLFEKKNETVVSKEEIIKKWDRIDKKNKGYITRKEASTYLAKNQKGNLLNRILHTISSKFDLENNLMILINILIFVAIFKAIFLFVSRYTSQLLSIRITKDLRMRYFEHIQSLPLSFYNQHNIGALSSRALGDAGQIASSLNSCLINYLQTPFTILANLFACFYISWKLSLGIFVGIPFIIIPIVFLTKRVKRVSRQMQKNQESFNSILIDFLSGIHTVKIFAMERFSLKKYKKQNDKMALLEGKNAKYSILTRPILHAITTLSLAFIVIIGLYTLKMTVAQIIVFCGLLHLFYEPVKKFAEENSNIQKGVVAAERMFEVLHLTPSIKDIDGAIELNNFKDNIEFRNVSFRYKKRWVLKNLSFSIKKGETVAIVGPTGAGKSTIVQLLPRLFDIQKGDILIDGISILNYTQKSLRENIAFVPQKPFLFYDTVLENIAFGRNFSKEEIIFAAKKSYSDEFINNLPKKYDTLLEETGKTLSGGQQQRIAIARALVKKAPILILDEATSSLDAVSENKIKMALEQLKGEMTQIIIAHRLSTIAHADNIIYLEDGKKLAEGKKDDLLKSSKEFRLMWQNFHSKVNF